MQFEEFLVKLKKQYELVKKRDLDFVLAVTGAEGVGKSNLALQIATTIDQNFDHSRIFFSEIDLLDFYNEIVEQIKKNDKGKVYVFDEAQNLFSRRNYSRKFVKDFIAFLKTARFLQNFYIFNTPTLSSLDPELLRRLDAVIYLPNRSTALFFLDENLIDFIARLERLRRNYGAFFDERKVLREFSNEIKANAKIEGITRVSGDIYDEYYEHKRIRTLSFVKVLENFVNDLKIKK